MEENTLHINFDRRPISLKEMAQRSIKNAIFEGQLKPKILYSDLNIAKTLGISKTPVREALIELASNDLLIHEPRKGFRIRTLNKEEIKNLFDFRMTLELSIIKRVVPVITSEGIAKLEKILSDNRMRIEQDENYNKSIVADRLFHLQLAKLNENLFFLKAIKQVRDLCDLAGRWSLINKKRKYEAQKEHEELLERIKSKSVEDAVEKMRAHLLSTCNNVLKKL